MPRSSIPAAQYQAGSAAARSASDRASEMPCRATNRPAGDAAKAPGGGVHATASASSSSIVTSTPSGRPGAPEGAAGGGQYQREGPPGVLCAGTKNGRE